MNTEAIADHVVEMGKHELSPLIARFVEGRKNRPGSLEAGCEGHPEAALRDAAISQRWNQAVMIRLAA